MSDEQDTETRFIGGNRVLLVRQYTGMRRRKSSDTKKCLLERNVSLVEQQTEQQTEEKESVVTKVEENHSQVTRNYSLIGTGAVAATALIGAWFYVQNSE